MMITLIVCAGLVLVIVIQNILHYIERKELYDRLMSRNLSEFKSNGYAPQGSINKHKKVLKDWRKKE